LASRLALLGRAVPVTCLGVTQVPACGLNDEVLRYHGLNAASLAERVRHSASARKPRSRQQIAGVTSPATS
jgi:hypothetical protein